MSKEAVKPQDVLPDGEDFKVLRGVRVRKGTIFAAMQNMALLQSESPERRQEALAILRELAPGLVALGVHDHFLCRDPVVQEILDQAAAEMNSN